MFTEISPKLHVRIEGDSWGCGVWDFNEQGDYLVVHKGFQHFLEEAGFKVSNYSRAGQGLETYFSEPVGNEDVIIVFLTDPLRDIDTSPFSSYSELVTINKLLQQMFYKRIRSKILTQITVPIIILGGCSKVQVDIMNKIVGLICEVPSILEFFYPKFKHPQIWFSDWLEDLDKRFSLEDLDLFIADKKAQDSIMDGPFTEFTVPDGRHPNLEGCKKLADFYIPRLKYYESKLSRLL